MSRTESLTLRLTAVASEAFENHRMFVYLRDGVYWLASWVEGDTFMSLRAVGILKSGFRRIAADIRQVAKEY